MSKSELVRATIPLCMCEAELVGEPHLRGRDWGWVCKECGLFITMGQCDWGYYSPTDVVKSIMSWLTDDGPEIVNGIPRGKFLSTDRVRMWMNLLQQERKTE